MTVTSCLILFREILFAYSENHIGLNHINSLLLERRIYIQYGLVLRRGCVLEYLVVNRIVVKRVLFKWFKLR
jgi:hypothetical protein